MTEPEGKQSGATPRITRQMGSGEISAPASIEAWMLWWPPLCHKAEPAAEREGMNSTKTTSSWNELKSSVGTELKGPGDGLCPGCKGCWELSFLSLPVSTTAGGQQ